MKKIFLKGKRLVDGVCYKVEEETNCIYIIHKDADGKYDTEKREPLGKWTSGTPVEWTKKGAVQQTVARSFMNKEIITSKAKHPDDTDLDQYKMTFFDCNAEVPIVGEEFNIKMGGVTYEVTDEMAVDHAGHPDPDKYVVKYNGAVLNGLLFDTDVEDGKKLDEKTAGQLVGLKDNSKQFRSAHRDRVKRMTSPQKKKRTVKTTASELAKKSAGGSAVSPA